MLPDYPGSSQYHFYALPVPTFVYRGRLLRADERGVRGLFYQGPRAELDVSLGGAVPVSSDDNDARRGMPDLDWMGEIGPSLRLSLWRPAQNRRLDVDLNLRSVFSTDLSSVSYRGIVAAPELAWRQGDLLKVGSRLRLAIGPIFATEEYMSYFYEVQDRYVRPDRQAYSARAGYLATRLQGSYRFPVTSRFSLFAGARLDLLYGATNEDSPLFRSDVNGAVLIGAAYSLYQSSRTVTEPGTLEN